MEDFFASWVIDKGLKARSIKLSIKPFTLIGANTRYGMVSSPLRDRFGSVDRLDLYDDDAMLKIVARSARILEIPLHSLYRVYPIIQRIPKLFDRSGLVQVDFIEEEHAIVG